MKTGEFLLLAALIFIAPHLRPIYGACITVCLALLCAIWVIYA
ncbi:hypothetical protein [Xenophilus sp. Marseille-Q4582]|nr:hypothetical protein [Xenophilus sp. Marseille-Q4582]